MPTVLRIGSFRFHFFANEGHEPPHIHVRSPHGECKFWLTPIRLERNKGIRLHDLRTIEKIVYEYRDLFIEKYIEFQRGRRV